MPVAVVDEQEAGAGAPEAPTPVSGLDLLDSAAAIARLEAQIDKDMVEYAKRPRRSSSAPAPEYRFCPVRRGLAPEDRTRWHAQLPEAARGRVYGSLLLSVVIRPTAASTRSKCIVRAVTRCSTRPPSASCGWRPHAAFPPDIRKGHRHHRDHRTWNFTSADRVQAE